VYTKSFRERKGRGESWKENSKTTTSDYENREIHVRKEKERGSRGRIQVTASWDRPREKRGGERERNAKRKGLLLLHDRGELTARKRGGRGKRGEKVEKEGAGMLR